MTSLKIGFGKDGLTLNSKKFDPLNLSVNGHGIESDRSLPQVDPFEILSTLASIKSAGDEVAKLDKIKALRSVVKY